MTQLLLGILNKFILPQAIHAATAITAVDLCQENQKADEDLMFGSALHAYLQGVSDELAGTSELIQFYVHVREFLTKLVESTVHRLPFGDAVLNDIIWLDPRERTSCTVSMVRRLAHRFSNFVSSENLDVLEEEFCLYQTTRDLPSDLVSQPDIDIDFYWGRLGQLQGATSKLFGNLACFAKCLLLDITSW